MSMFRSGYNYGSYISAINLDKSMKFNIKLLKSILKTFHIKLKFIVFFFENYLLDMVDLKANTLTWLMHLMVNKFGSTQSPWI